ncbi:MAG: radical SAM protein, partial [Planctomycetaceae bacterium]|nr:radical SAM protein [Planctomycetaceae bacterium]
PPPHTGAPPAPRPAPPARGAPGPPPPPGARELVLISQDTTAFGKDRPGSGDTLAGLLESLLAKTSVPRLRVLYAHPAHLDTRTMDLLTGEPRLLGYLDLPVQHIADSVLGRMNRGYGRERVEEIVGALSRADGFTLRTTFLLGYPGETDRDFREALEYVREGHFQHLGAFAYSAEPGTPAFGMDGQVPPEVARERRDAILAAQSEIAFAWLDSRVGKTEKALVDARPEEGWVLARTRREAPDADGILYLRDDHSRPEEVVKACITERKDYDLVGYVAAAGKKAAAGGKRKKRR